MRISDWSSDVCSSDLTGYAGGIKGVTAAKVLEGRFPERVLEKAIERMIPRGPLGRQQMRNLRIFAGAAHPHEAQNPEVLRSEEHTSELQSLMRISYAVFCLKKKNNDTSITRTLNKLHTMQDSDSKTTDYKRHMIT